MISFIYIQNTDKSDSITCIYTLDAKTKLIKNIEATITENPEHKLYLEVRFIKTHKKEILVQPKPKEEKPDFDEEKEWQKYLRKKKGFLGRLFED